MQKRPDKLGGTTSKIVTGCGSMYVTINEDANGKPFEVFIQMGKAGGCAMSHMVALGKTISVALRSGADVAEIARHIIGTRCIRPVTKVMGKGEEVLSCSDGVGRVMVEYLLQKGGAIPSEQTEIPLSDPAPYPKEAAQGAIEAQPAPTPPPVPDITQEAHETQDSEPSEHHGPCPQCRVGVMCKQAGRSCDRCDRCGYSECE